MHILMFTNTFTPHVGGVARSVEQFTAEYRHRGHRVLVVAPEFSPKVANESGVVRMPAIQNFNGSDFSVAVPIPGYLNSAIADFEPDIVHSHHPFILGDTALRFSAKYDIPIVFTHHTQYEKYTHYVPGDSPAMKRFAIDLAVGYCNLCDAVIAPSATIRQRLEEQGVTTPIAEIPTGVDVGLFSTGNGSSYRHQLGIPAQAFVVGHVGRLAPEKGLDFLDRSGRTFRPRTRDGVLSGRRQVDRPPRTSAPAFDATRFSIACISPGELMLPHLADAYAAMDVFAFASQTETQGMVLTEAMAAGLPVVAVDAPGVREVLVDGKNGISLANEDLDAYVAALADLARQSDDQRALLVRGARQTADRFSMRNSAPHALALYERLVKQGSRTPRPDDAWSVARRRIESEWQIWSNVAGAITHAVTEDPQAD